MKNLRLYIYYFFASSLSEQSCLFFACLQKLPSLSWQVSTPPFSSRTFQIPCPGRSLVFCTFLLSLVSQSSFADPIDSWWQFRALLSIKKNKNYHFLKDISLLLQQQYVCSAWARLIKIWNRASSGARSSAKRALKADKILKKRCERENQSWARNCVASHNQLVSGKTDNFLSTRTIVRAGVLRLSSFLVSSIRD